MEPRRIRRGNLSAERRPARPRQALQWSRGEFAAETQREHGGSSGLALLQWSRGEFAAETQIAGDLIRDMAGFNGAAANSPRKPCAPP